MPQTIKGERVPIRLWANPHDVEPDALKQLKVVAGLPWVAHHVAVMPDVHVGSGATVGSVLAMRGAVAPAAVGVDIGCGMMAVKSGISASRLPDDLRPLRLAIEDAIPVGPRQHLSPAWTESPTLRGEAEALLRSFDQLEVEDRRFIGRAQMQLGTLGGGNHFIEVCLDTDQAVWLMLHSGSRFIGASLAERHMAEAARLLHNRTLPDPALSVFLAGTPQFDAYRHALY